jgi:hypothetical protein
MSILKLLYRVAVAAAVVGLAAIGAILAYTIENDSGRTGAHPWHALFVFLPVLLVGIVQIIVSRRAESGFRGGLLAVIVALAGIALLVYLDLSNTLLHYREWAGRYTP